MKFQISTIISLLVAHILLSLLVYRIAGDRLPYLDSCGGIVLVGIISYSILWIILWVNREILRRVEKKD